MGERTRGMIAGRRNPAVPTLDNHKENDLESRGAICYSCGITFSVFFMTYQDLLTIVLFVAVVVFFSDGGPGTPRRIRIPIPSMNWSA
jgi:hypothetical protein